VIISNNYGLLVILKYQIKFLEFDIFFNVKIKAMNKIQIDGLFFKQSDIQDILKCPACKSAFDDPRILPCGDSICFDCLIFIKDRNNNENFLCPECGERFKDSNNLPVNKILKKQLNLEAKEIYRNEFVEELKTNLQILFKETNELQNILQNPAIIVQDWSESNWKRKNWSYI